MVGGHGSVGRAKSMLHALGRRLDRTPVVGTVLQVQRRYTADHAGSLATAIAYNAFLSLFPLMLLALSIIGFVLTDPAERARWVERIAGSIPGLKPIIGDSIGALTRDRTATGVVGLLSLAWTGTNVVRAAGAALNRIFGIPDLRGIRAHLWALGSLAPLGALVLASVGAGTAIASIANGAPVLLMLAFVVTLAVDFVIFIVSYRLLAQRKGPPYRALWPGALSAAIGWSFLKTIGVWYATRTVTGATAVYGAFAATVGVLVMLSLGARMFLYGAEANAVLVERKRGTNVRKATNLSRHNEIRRRANA
jgi:membrane protein